MQDIRDYHKDTQTGEILDYYKGLADRASQEVIVDMLRELQELYGCISPALGEMAAEAAGVKASTIKAIVKRIPSLKEAAYQKEIVICVGKSCAAKGNLELLQKMRKQLDVSAEGISGDGKVCLRTRACLKHCRTSPNVMVDQCLLRTIPDIGI